MLEKAREYKICGMSSEIEGYIAHNMWQCRGETI